MTWDARGNLRTGILRVSGGGVHSEVDAVATEAPLEVRVHGAPLAVLMRTPGDDLALAAGFLFAERIVWRPEDLVSIEPCTSADHPQAGNILNVTLQGSAAVELDRFLAQRRQIAVNSSCGLCGRLTVESLQVQAPYIESPTTAASSWVPRLFEELRSRQTLFGDTGGLHAAALFEADGSCLVVCEDVGRHNAVDKVVGRELLERRLPASSCVLAVSGRASFEIVQKTFLAGIPILVAVSAPTSLAVQLAEAAGVTLVGFARHDGFNVYTHPERVRLTVEDSQTSEGLPVLGDAQA